MTSCEPNYRRRGYVAKKPIIELIRTSTFAMRCPPKPAKPSGDTLAPVPASSPELVQQPASRKDRKTLGATLSAIALSVSSRFSDARDTSSDGATVQGMSEIRETAYAAVRKALEITKEPSCLCPPLMAVVGAMSALMNLDEELRCECFMFTNSIPSHPLTVSCPSKHWITRGM